jgi:hypothetical protein
MVKKQLKSRWRVKRPFYLTLFVLLGMFMVTIPIFADDVTGSATVTGGSLVMSAADNPAFPSTTLNGTDQTQTDTIDIDVQDFTGSGAGWNLQVTSTTFNDGSGHTLATTATQVTGVSSVCDGGTCTNPTNAIGYPLTVPADTVAPTAVKFFNATANTGMGDFTVTPTLELSIPASTFAGTYNSTVTITIASGP